MTARATDDAIDQIIATCDGSLRGAIKALMLVNEQLERELAEVTAVVAHGNPADTGRSMVH